MTDGITEQQRAASKTRRRKAGALQVLPMLPMGIYEVTLGFWLLIAAPPKKRQ